MVTDGIRGSVIGTKDELKACRKRLVQYIVDTLYTHNTYALGYFFCEFLNFINVVSMVSNDRPAASCSTDYLQLFD